MIDVYHKIVTHTGGGWKDFIISIELMHIFDGIFNEFPDDTDSGCLIKYIVYAYSIKSQVVDVSADWADTKRKLFEKANIKPEAKYYNAAFHLQSEAILSSVVSWLNYQDSELFAELKMLQDLRVEMQLSCVTPIKKASGEVDYDQKFKNADYCIKLRKIISDIKSELIQNNEDMKDRIKEVRSSASKMSISFGPETFATK